MFLKKESKFRGWLTLLLSLALVVVLILMVSPSIVGTKIVLQ